MDIIIKNKCCIYSTRLIQEEFHNPKVSRKLFLQKRKKENIRNISKSQKQNNKEKIHLLTEMCAHFEIQEAIPTKKKERER